MLVWCYTCHSKLLYFVHEVDIIIEKGYEIVSHTRRTLPCSYSHC